MHICKFEGNADFCEKYLLNTQNENGKTALPMGRI
jgi:hypothetical protein